MTGDDHSGTHRSSDRHSDGHRATDRPDGRAGGTYTLLLARDDPGEITVGALGSFSLPAGAYAYVGSALGTGGFARVDRHRRVASGDHDTRHWHIDYLIGDPNTRLVSVVTTAGLDAECRIAEEIRARVAAPADTEAGSSGPDPVPGFGASDCDCRSHLIAHGSVDGLRMLVSEAHDSA